MSKVNSTAVILIVYLAIAFGSQIAPSANRVALAQSSLCGDPPPVANETLKGQIEGKANFLSHLLGDASLAGQIETSREEIFSKYPDQEERSDAYFEYMFCAVIMNDETMTTRQKIEELTSVRKTFHELKNPSTKGDINVEDSCSVIIGDGNTASTVCE